jgi:hypothetical protein
LYAQKSLDVVFSKTHEFLSRFRRVAYDGSIATKEDTELIAIPDDVICHKVIIDPNGKVYVSNFKNKTYALSWERDEVFVECHFPFQFLMNDNMERISLEDLNKYMDTFKVDRPKLAPVKNSRATRLDIIEELFEDDDDAPSLKFD